MAFRLLTLIALCCPLFIGTAYGDCACWRYVRTGTAGKGTTLAEIASPGAGTAWAAGSQGAQPMLLRWTGVRWRKARLPFPASTLLEGVAAPSRRDAWVVGYDDGRPAVARWRGRGWTNVPFPKAGPTFPRAVDARTATEAWIVGSSSGFAGTQAATWRWDGDSWHTVRIPDGMGLNSELVAVSAADSADAWAVGSRSVNPPRQLLLHWDGRAWTSAPAPDLPGETMLTDVVTLAPNNAWAVGAISSSTSRWARWQRPPRGDRPLAEHWDGHAWRVVPGPPVDGRFFSVAGDGTGGIWAAGQRSGGTALLAHWDGLRWDISRAPTPDGRGPAAAWAVTQVPGTPYLWAAGHTESPAYQALTWTNAPRPR